MIKRFTVILCLMGCLLLLLFSVPAMEAAREGLRLWYETLLPALFPFFVLSGLLQRTGLLAMVSRWRLRLPCRIPASAVPVFLISSLSGAPTGARICGLMLDQGALSREEAQRFAAIFNLASPMFLTGALANNMLGSPDAALPLLLGSLASALIVCPLLCGLRPLPSSKRQKAAAGRPPFSLALELTGALWDGVTAMLRIGGTVVLFVVLVHLMDATGLMGLICRPFAGLLARFHLDPQLMRAAITGTLEMTNGCRELSQLALPLRLRAALCSGTVAAGGLCVLMQSMAFLELKPLEYLTVKQFQSLIAGGVTYLLFPLFCPSAADASLQWNETLFQRNATAGLAIVAACLFAMFVTWFFAQLLQRLKRRLKG